MYICPCGPYAYRLLCAGKFCRRFGRKQPVCRVFPCSGKHGNPRTHRCTYRHAEPNAVGNTYPDAEPDSNPCTNARRNARTNTGTHRRAGCGSCP